VGDKYFTSFLSFSLEYGVQINTLSESLGLGHYCCVSRYDFPLKNNQDN
jgi:hypothetical protein